MTRLLGLSLVLLAAAPMGAAVLPAEAGQQARTAQSNDEWCREAQRNNDNERETFCEVREFTLGAGPVTAETSNGSMSVTGERRGDVLVRAMVFARARTAERAREIGREITVSTSGTIKATGPRSYNREGWHVSFRIQAPNGTDLNLTSSNGSLSASDVRGRLRLRTSNGSIRLMDVGGDVQADTSNGSVNATLSGSTWDGAGLSIQTSNGSVRLTVPETYNARLVAGTSNGSINVGFPVTVQGNLRRGRDIDTTLGSGGPTISVRTSNGSVRLERR
ncbi:MAG TPA: DUF4097 family beta strand repeat-containing protein [Vicinamibacterales bacterium]